MKRSQFSSIFLLFVFLFAFAASPFKASAETITISEYDFEQALEELKKMET